MKNHQWNHITLSYLYSLKSIFALPYTDYTSSKDIMSFCRTYILYIFIAVITQYEIYCLNKILNVQWYILNYRHYTVRQISRTFILYNCNFIPIDQQNSPFSPPSTWRFILSKLKIFKRLFLSGGKNCLQSNFENRHPLLSSWSIL